MLTRKQHQLLLFINDHLRAQGVSPSFEEMKDALGLKSKSGIHRLITGLEERGFIRRLAHRARALEVIRLPEDASTAAKDGRKKAFTQNWVVAHPLGYGAVARVAITLKVPDGEQGTPEFQALVEALDKQVGDAKMPEA